MRIFDAQINIRQFIHPENSPPLKQLHSRNFQDIFVPFLSLKKCIKKIFPKFNEINLMFIHAPWNPNIKVLYYTIDTGPIYIGVPTMDSVH